MKNSKSKIVKQKTKNDPDGLKLSKKDLKITKLFDESFDSVDESLDDILVKYGY